MMRETVTQRERDRERERERERERVSEVKSVTDVIQFLSVICPH